MNYRNRRFNEARVSQALAQERQDSLVEFLLIAVSLMVLVMCLCVLGGVLEVVK